MRLIPIIAAGFLSLGACGCAGPQPDKAVTPATAADRSGASAAAADPLGPECTVLGSTAFRHAGVRHVRWSPDGETIVSAGGDEWLRIWDSATGEQLTAARLPGLCTALTFSGDGSRLALGWTDDYKWQRKSGVAVWDVKSREWLPALPTPKWPVHTIAFSPNRRLLAWDEGSIVRVCDAHTSRTVGELTGHRQTILSLAFLPDGRGLVTGAADGTVRVWDSDAGRTRLVLPAGDRPVRAIAVSPDGKSVAAACDDGAIRLWQTDTGRLIASHPEDRGLFVSLDWLSSETVVTGAGDGELWFRDMAGGPVRRVRVPGGGVRDISCHSRHGEVAVASYDSVIRVWLQRSGALSPPGRGHTGCVTAVCVSDDGGLVASGSADKTVLIWNADTGALLRRIGETADTVTTVAMSPDKAIVVAADYARNLRAWRLADGRPLWQLSDLPEPVAAIAFTADGHLLVGMGNSSGNPGRLQRRSLRDGALVHEYAGDLRSLSVVAESADGKRTLAGTCHGRVVEWEGTVRRREVDCHLPRPTNEPPGPPIDLLSGNVSTGAWFDISPVCGLAFRDGVPVTLIEGNSEAVEIASAPKRGPSVVANRTCRADRCALSADGRTAVVLDSVARDSVAVNSAGRLVWTNLATGESKTSSRTYDGVNAVAIARSGRVAALGLGNSAILVCRPPRP